MPMAWSFVARSAALAAPVAMATPTKATAKCLHVHFIGLFLQNGLLSARTSSSLWGLWATQHTGFDAFMSSRHFVPEGLAGLLFRFIERPALSCARAPE